MRWITTYDSDGKYLSCHTDFSDNPSDILPANTYIGRVSIGQQYHDLVNNVPVDISPAPSDVHVFNYKIKSWEVDIQSAWNKVKWQRKRLIDELDLDMLAQEPGRAAEIAQYKKDLHAVTSQPDPTRIVWPTPPQR